MDTNPEIFLSNSERSKVSKLYGGDVCVCNMEEGFGKEWMEKGVCVRSIIFAKRTKLVNTIMTSKI